MEDENNFRIRPAARIVNTLGKELIKDDLAAVVELVKNSYDADSPEVRIKYSYSKIENAIKICVIDTGHGMSRDTVINKWLVPGTSDKLDRKRSPKKKRVLQGRKGIGRYAAGILGQQLFLSTVDEEGIKTELLMDWSDIASHTYLDEVDILVESTESDEKSGTLIEITNFLNKHKPVLTCEAFWSDKKLEKLRTELRKLISPLKANKRDTFSIHLEFGEFPSSEFNNVDISIDPLPLLDLYDYRVYGSISRAGKIDLTYENQCLKPVQKEKVDFNVSSINEEFLKDVTCGKIDFDLRVFDRDSEAIDEIVKRVKIHSGLEMSKLEIRRWLNEFNGIGIYKGGFRIRPYGDADYDWLNLGSRRVDIPTVRIGSNQIIGLIGIEAEEISGLEEKSARDGLIENYSYSVLKNRIFDLIRILEERRYKYRVSSGRGRKLVNIEKTLESLFNFDDIANDLSIRLKKLKVPENEIGKINSKIFAIKEEKSKELEDIKETIAYYQGQANLGKMVGHILHEGRKPIAFFRNTLPPLSKAINYVIKSKGDTTEIQKFEEDIPFLEEESEKLYELFASLDPFAFKKSERIKVQKLSPIIEKSFKLFEHELNSNGINFENKIATDINVYARTTEMGWVFANLIENSLFWLKSVNQSKKIIKVVVQEKGDYHILEFFDNGPGAPEEYLEDGRLFEPGISAKQEGSGTGMGLAIVGELVKRNHGDVWAMNKNDGISFYIRVPSSKEAVL